MVKGKKRWHTGLKRALARGSGTLIRTEAILVCWLGCYRSVGLSAPQLHSIRNDTEYLHSTMDLLVLTILHKVL